VVVVEEVVDTAAEEVEGTLAVIEVDEVDFLEAEVVETDISLFSP
jgi:hypothetical protein